MSDLTAAVDAAARAHFDRGQAQRRDDGRKRPDGQPWQFEDLTPLDQHALREFVAPIVAAVMPHARAAALIEAADAYDPEGEMQARGWVVGWLVERAGMEAER